MLNFHPNVVFLLDISFFLIWNNMEYLHHVYIVDNSKINWPWPNIWQKPEKSSSWKSLLGDLHAKCQSISKSYPYFKVKASESKAKPLQKGL